MNENDNLGRSLSPEQTQFFADSKIRDESGKLLTMYHGSSYEFDAFDISKIRANETDAYYNGFWFSTDEFTLPAWTRLKSRYEVYLNVTKPAPMDIVKQTIRQVRSEWMQSGFAGNVLRPEANSVQDEVRYRLQDMGYDGIIHDWKPKIDTEELERTGQTKVTSVRGTEYLLKKDEVYGGLDLFYYDKDEPGNEGDHLTGYEDVEDYLSLQECTVVCFRPEQIKAVDNRTPTLDPNFKVNTPEKEVCEMTDRKGYEYTDSYGGTYTLYPKLNTYLNNNLYLGFDFYDPEEGAIFPFCAATVNMDEVYPFLQSCIDTNNNGFKMVEFLMDNGFGKPTGMAIPSGFCAFPVFEFNADKLREIDPNTFNAYAKAHGMHKPGLADQISAAKTKAAQQQNKTEEKAPDHER